jgi:hypothetical protein
VSQAEIISITTRRNAMFGLAAAVTGLVAPALAVAASTDPDAELIIQCDYVTKLRGEMNAVVDAMIGLSSVEADEFQDDLDRTSFAYSEAVELVAALPAVSPAGVRAKAVILRESIEEEVGLCGGEVMGDTQHKLAWSLVCDLTALPV